MKNPRSSPKTSGSTTATSAIRVLVSFIALPSASSSAPCSAWCSESWCSESSSASDSLWLPGRGARPGHGKKAELKPSGHVGARPRRQQRKIPPLILCHCRYFNAWPHHPGNMAGKVLQPATLQEGLVGHHFAVAGRKPVSRGKPIRGGRRAAGSLPPDPTAEDLSVVAIAVRVVRVEVEKSLMPEAGKVRVYALQP